MKTALAIVTGLSSVVVGFQLIQSAGDPLLIKIDSPTGREQSEEQQVYTPPNLGHPDYSQGSATR